MGRTGDLYDESAGHPAFWWRGLICRVVPRLAVSAIIALCLGAAASTSSASAAAGGKPHHRVVARAFVRPDVGGYVRARSGVSIFVPPGVMRKPGVVTITAYSHWVFGIHIHAPWRGTVAISLPLKPHGDSIVHSIGGLWLTEGHGLGEQTVWVTQLSLFSKILNTIKSIPSKLCLVFNRSEFIKCVIEKGLGTIDAGLAKWIISKLPGSCAAHIAEDGLLGGGPAGVFIGALSDPACTGVASSPGPGPTSTPKPSPSPSPQPSPNPTPTPIPNPTPTPNPPPQTWSEQETPNHPVNTFTDYHNASGMGPPIVAGQWVQVSCKVHDPTIASVNPDGYWYRIASAPWGNSYYSPANTFMNGDPYGGPYTHNTDFSVPDC